MIRALFNFLLKIRGLIQRWGGRIFEKFRDSDTGKVKGVSPQTLKNIAMIAAAVFFLTIILIQIFGGQSNIPGGLDAFRNEMTPKLGVGESEQNYKSAFSDDPLSVLNNLKNNEDPLAGLKGGAGSGDGSGSSGEGGIITGAEEPPNISECLDLVEKLKTGVVLEGEEKVRAELCLEKNIAGLSAEELALAKKLLSDPNASEAQKELLRQALRGDLDPDSAEARLAKALAKNEEGAAAAMAALEAKNRELMEAMLKKMDDQPLSAEEASMVSAFEKMLAEKSAAGALDDPSKASNREDAAKNLAADVAAREAALRDLQSQIAEAQARAAQAGEKLAKGLTLSPEEQAAIQRLADLQKKQSELAKLQEARKAALARILAELQKTLSQVSLTMQQTFPSGVTVELNEALVDCNKIKPLFKAVKKKGTGKGGQVAGKGNKEVWLDQNGEPLTPDKVRLVQLFRKQKAEQDKLVDGLKNPLTGDGSMGGMGEKVDVAAMMGEDGAVVEVAALTVFADKSLKSFNLTPDMKIPAILESEVLVSDKGSGQTVRVRIIDDVHNPENGQIVIPKGAIAIATASGFDPDIGVMDMRFDKVTVGSGKTLPVKLAVGSADGTMGLKGQVRDTRGKFLLGAFITSFSAGALNWFSQSIVQPFQTSTDAGEAILGASLAGGAEVMNRIAELYAGDLQNAAKVFWVPKGVPVVLFPE